MKIRGINKRDICVAGGLLVLSACTCTSAQAQNQGDMGALMNAMGALMSGGTNAAAVVDFRELKALLPASLPGMTRANASGEKSGAMGMTIATAEGIYKGDAGANITIKITDMGGTGGLMAMAQMGWAAGEIDRESDTGYEKTTTINGNKAQEKYDTQDKSGEIQVLVAQRFTIEIRGNNVKAEALKAAVSQIDVNKLATLKPPAAPAVQ